MEFATLKFRPFHWSRILKKLISGKHPLTKALASKVFHISYLLSNSYMTIPTEYVSVFGVLSRVPFIFAIERRTSGAEYIAVNPLKSAA
jgi:hypothetical protein